MKAFFCSAYLLVVIAISSSSAASPAFCNGLDCPIYTSVRNSTAGYEIREYIESKWASAWISGASNLTKVMSTGFQDDFQYISGANDKNQKIEMTAPVWLHVPSAQGPFCESNITVSFYAPFVYQNLPVAQIPRPNKANVYINDVAAKKVAVISFGGYVLQDSDITEEVAKLGAMLDKDGVKYDKNQFSYAGYDSPFKVFDRHNEAWLYLL